MKQFVVIFCRAGIFVQQKKAGIPRNVVHSSHDTYEEAKAERDMLREKAAIRADKAHSKWHNDYNAAADRADWSAMCRLSGIPAYC